MLDWCQSFCPKHQNLKTEPENNLTWTRNGQDKAWKACTTTNINDLQWTTSCGCIVVGSICFFNHWNQWKWISNVSVHHCTPLCHCSQIHPLTKTCMMTKSSQNIPHQSSFRKNSDSTIRASFSNFCIRAINFTIELSCQYWFSLWQFAVSFLIQTLDT